MPLCAEKDFFYKVVAAPLFETSSADVYPLQAEQASS
jgi:hypothetical protein